MKQALLPLLAGLSLAGCVTPDGWSEAPRYDDRYGYERAPVGWWGSNAASIDVFYGPLASYGRWDMHPRYGRVFLPAGIGAGWQPYSRGYWADDPRYGRRWVSAEPFGWATYHYGRWGRDTRLGWFWVPDTRFAGSWVDWRDSGGYASWAPLPPPGWDRFGYRWGNDWWLSTPRAYAWRPGLDRHVRPGRPEVRPDSDRYRDRDRDWEQVRRPDRERPDGVVPGRPPRSEQGWQQRDGLPTASDWRARQARERNPAWQGRDRPVPGNGWQGSGRPPGGNDAAARPERPQTAPSWGGQRPPRTEAVAPRPATEAAARPAPARAEPAYARPERPSAPARSRDDGARAQPQ